MKLVIRVFAKMRFYKITCLPLKKVNCLPTKFLVCFCARGKQNPAGDAFEMCATAIYVQQQQ